MVNAEHREVGPSAYRRREGFSYERLARFAVQIGHNICRQRNVVRLGCNVCECAVLLLRPNG